MKLERSAAHRTGWGQIKVPQWGQLRVPRPSGLSLGSVGLPGERDQELYDLEVSKLRNLRSSRLTIPQFAVNTQDTGVSHSNWQEASLQSWGGSGAGHTQSANVPGTLGSLALFASPEEWRGCSCSERRDPPRSPPKGWKSKDPRSTLLLVAVE